ncbi:MAG: hypothetical protein IJ753_07680 [Bacteroidales bacterium]|nr:hypothetical protein [Bacteroidales bacterium]
MKRLLKKMQDWYRTYCTEPDDWENMDYYERKNYSRSVLAGFSFVQNLLLIPLLIIVATCSHGCAGPSKLQKVQAQQMAAEIGLVEQYEMQDQSREGDVVRPDTLVVQDAQGNEMILMKAIKDENGDMVATDVISAAVVEARFRNVAERHGKVDIAFQIRVPKEMQDEEWQLRFYPEMHILEDTLNLDQVVITGAKYRKAQLRGYQQYEKFLASIVTDSTRFINMRLLELFIQRNIPDLYAFKVDSTEVADEHFNAILDTQVASSFASEFGVTGREAIEHYTNTISKHRNARRWGRRNEMFEKYVRVPIVHEGLRLDTVITAENGDFVYNYVQTIATRPKLRKVDVVLSGDIYKQDKRLYEIPATEPLTYYISSLSAFVDGTPRYKKQIISRRVQANTACYIDFEQGSAEIMEELSHNASEMGRIKENLASLIENREFDLDSIVVTASCSPEGTMPFNTRLSQRRSESVSQYFDAFIREYREEMRKEAETAYYFDSLDDEILRSAQNDSPEVRFISRSNPENWRMLDVLVAEDTVLTAFQKQEYKDLAAIADADQREWALAHAEYYRHLREDLYPRLRTVKFDFHLHRKGMVKDTIQTTVLDEEYMAGVQAIRDRDYETAITLLRPYQDYNTAVAFCAMDYNASALAILEALDARSELGMKAQIDYMLAVIYSRQGKNKEAVERYLKACDLTPSYWHRGNLDPEISELIKKYGLNQER